MKKMDGLWEDIDKDVLTRLKLDLGMTPPKIKRDVAGIREWINLQPHLPNLPGMVRIILNLKNYSDPAGPENFGPAFANEYFIIRLLCN